MRQSRSENNKRLQDYDVWADEFHPKANRTPVVFCGVVLFCILFGVVI